MEAERIVAALSIIAGSVETTSSADRQFSILHFSFSICRIAMSDQILRLILASNSPRRAQLLSEHGYDFEVICPPVVEPEPHSGRAPPAHWAEALSYFKARSVAKDLTTGIVLAADTVVALKDQLFGKPADLEDARRILEALCGTEHQVITGVTVLNVATGLRRIEHEITWVVMRKMSDDVLERYLQSGMWKGKAGAYGIQDRADANIERISGSYSNVVGLPMERVKSMLAELGIRSTMENGELESQHKDQVRP